FVTGSIGLLGTQPSYRMMMDCDTLLMVGSAFPYSEFLPEEGHARGVQIDIEPRMTSIRYPMEVNLIGDSRETLARLLPLLSRKTERRWRARIEKDVAEWWKTLEARAMVDADPINPQRVFWELSPRIPDRAILTCDSGSSANWYARDLKLREGMMASLSGGLATMGPGVPYAIAAKFAHPDRIAIAMEGDPKYAASQDIPDFPYARYAESIGLAGIRVDRADRVGAGWDAALAADRPALLEFVTAPDVPPLPPHITFKQARAYAESIVKGDPDAKGIVRASIKQLFA